MIKYLQEDYLKHFQLTRPGCQVISYSLNGRCELYDPKSCNPCISNRRQQCDAKSIKQIFLLETKNSLHCVKIEEYLSQFAGTKAEPRKRCDLMIYDKSKIAFVEMYCGQEKYIHPHGVEKKIGKLATARQQITETLDKLCEVPSIESEMNTFHEKVGLFGFRRKNVSDEFFDPKQNVENNMNIFIRTAEVSSEGGYTILPHGFKFSVVTYPCVYVW